jgi:hypothetical protein
MYAKTILKLMSVKLQKGGVIAAAIAAIAKNVHAAIQRVGNCSALATKGQKPHGKAKGCIAVVSAIGITDMAQIGHVRHVTNKQAREQADRLWQLR